jgi:PAS domain-containing protein
VTKEVRWIARRGEVVSTQGVTARRFVGIAYDITDIEEARRLTEVNEAKWRGLFERMNEGFFVGEAVRNEVDRMIDFTFVEMNPAFEVQTGIADSTFGPHNAGCRAQHPGRTRSTHAARWPQIWRRHGGR